MLFTTRNLYSIKLLATRFVSNISFDVRREEKKKETRQRISDVATELFCARGFEVVTIDEIARAANVSKMTVSNYFPRKEDLMLDRTDDLLLLPFRKAVRERPKGRTPVDALGDAVVALRDHEFPLGEVSDAWIAWWRTVLGSPALTARLHELEDEAAEALASDLAGSKLDSKVAPVARLMAGMTVLTVRTARREAIRVFERGASVKKANAAFLSLVERGYSAIRQLAVTRDDAD